MLLTLEMIRSKWMQVLLAAHLHRLWNRERNKLWERNNPEKLKAKQFRANHSVKGKAKQSRYSRAAKSKERFHRYNKTEKAKQRLQRYADAHPDRIIESQRRYNKTEKSKLRLAKYEKRHPERRKEIHRRYRQTLNGKMMDERWKKAHMDKVRTMRLRYRNSEHGKLKAKEWKAKNPEKLRVYWSRTQKRRYATSPQFRLMKHYRGRTAKAFKAQGVKMSASTSKLMGCTWSELRAHIESKFQPGMTWENYGYRTWHVDHIRPIARFDLTDPKQVAECFNFRNLQPLPGAENIRKSDKYEEPALA